MSNVKFGPDDESIARVRGTKGTQERADASQAETGPWILGLGGPADDFSAALMRGRDIRVAIESERVTRVKYGTPGYLQDPFTECVEFCLQQVGIKIADVERIVSSDLLPQRTISDWSIETYPHHLCHAASAAMLLDPGASACILVYDGNGSARPLSVSDRGPGWLEVETFSAFRFEDGALARLGGTWGARYVERLGLHASCEDSVGQMYELISAAIGFDPLEAGKTMGLAAWGSPRFRDMFMEHMRIGDELDDVFAFDPFDRDFQQAVSRALRVERHSFEVRADLAASAQAVLTEVLFAFFKMVETLDFDVLCLAGGCALNSVANGLIASHLQSERRMVVPPCSGDSGVGLGALWLEAQREGPSSLTIRGRDLMPAIARPGPTYPVCVGGGVEHLDLARMSVDPSVTGPEALAEVISQGLVVGVFNGPSEIGPRALGGRSILADPRRFDLKERINRKIKRREPFRPLAPMVLDSAFERYFEPTAAANPFMLTVASATEECRRTAPGTVHVDGTARVQVVEEGSDDFLVALLLAFERITGVPILLNTSFNGPGQPIVETPGDAIDAFLTLGLDGLWLQNHFLRPVETGMAD